jgi:hypothetical protein
MRFLADENVSRLVVERLRAAGFDVGEDSVRKSRDSSLTTPSALFHSVRRRLASEYCQEGNDQQQ